MNKTNNLSKKTELSRTAVMRKTSLAGRDFEDLKIYEKVEILCNENSLSEAVKEGIMKLCKESYTKGSNDCYDIWVRCK
jgi:hypothetical protein